MTAIIKITDGTTEVNLIADETGFHLDNWTRVLATWKNGGIWRDPVLGEGRQLQFAKYGNVLETMTLNANATSQDAMIASEQKLIRLLNQSTDYWLKDDITINPVYLEVKASQETNTRYALIHDYRIPQIGNQFAAPYLQPGCLSSLDDFDLIIERGHWLANVPGSDTGISTSHLQNLTGTTTDEPGTDNDTVKYLGGNVTNSIIEVGNVVNNGPADIGLRFQTIAVPQGATILAAFMTLIADDTDSTSVFARILGEDADDASTFDLTGTDFENRLRTTAFVDWDIPAFASGTSYNTPDITPIVQEIVDRTGWASNNDMVFFLEDQFSPSNSTRQVKEYSAGAPRISLTIVFQESTTYGQEATSNNAVYIANKFNTANLTHIFRFDQSSGTYSSNLIGATTPFNLIPTGTIDRLVIGISDDDGDIEGPFNNIVFDVIPYERIFIQVSFAYYNGSFVSPSDQRNNTGTITGGTGEYFVNEGVTSIHFTQESDWIKTTLNGVSAYWVIIGDGVMSGVTTVGKQQNRDIYTVNSNFIDIANDQIGGDIRAIIRGVFEQQSGSPDDVSMSTNRFIFGARELLENDFFTSFLNCSDFQNGGGVTVTVGNDTTEGDSDLTTANGERSTFTATDTVQATRVTWNIADFAAQSYYGTFRVFFRGQQATKAGSNFAKVNIQVETGSGGVSFTGDQVAFEYTNDWQLLDLGTIRIPTSSLFNSSEISDTITINLQIQAATSGDVVRCYDICLIPTYDYAGDFIDKANTTTSVIDYQREIEIDSTSQPKVDLRAIVKNTETDKVTGVLQAIASDKFTLEARKNLRLYFLFARYGANDEWVSEPWICHSVQLFGSNRYITARGTD